MAAHLGSGLDVPHLHEVVARPADDSVPIWGEIDGPHPARVARQRVHLPPPTIFSDHFQDKIKVLPIRAETDRDHASAAHPPLSHWWSWQMVGFSVRSLYQEGPSEFCLGWQKFCLSFQSRIAGIITFSPRSHRVHQV